MRHLVKYGVIAFIIVWFFSSERMMIIPFIFLILAVSIPFQILYALKIKQWERQLQRRSVRQVEFHDLLDDLKLKGIPYPKDRDVPKKVDMF